MSEESTAELVEYTRIVAGHVDMPLVPFDAVMLDRAADRLAALDADKAALWTELFVIKGNLPPCPTCATPHGHDGCNYNAFVIDGYWMCEKCGWGQPCPANCDHGKVSIEQLVATYNAVHENYSRMLTSRGLLDHLRSVKPSTESPTEGTTQ